MGFFPKSIGLDNGLTEGPKQVNLTSQSSESADIETSSDDYASRFAGAVGRWFLDMQARTTLDLLRNLPANATILDVGGGHAQLVPDLVWAGYDVVVAGSHPSCDARLKLWLGRNCRFEVANLQALPYEDRAFDAVVCFRLLPHSVDWTNLIAELCRVARRSVVVDYPSVRSVNVISGRLYSLKKRVEKNTRPFMMFHPRQIGRAFEASDFLPAVERPQFIFPMVLHRLFHSQPLSRLMEDPASRLGLTRRFGSPVIVRADRITAEPVR